jgi:hypothetical protein
MRTLGQWFCCTQPQSAAWRILLPAPHTGTNTKHVQTLKIPTVITNRQQKPLLGGHITASSQFQPTISTQQRPLYATPTHL